MGWVGKKPSRSSSSLQPECDSAAFGTEFIETLVNQSMHLHVAGQQDREPRGTPFSPTAR